MNKILDKDFRTELYKNLVEIGYSKVEATSIVSVKYREALKDNIIEKFKAQIEAIDGGKKETILTPKMQKIKKKKKKR